MKLTDLLPLEKWVELEKEISDNSGLSANVFNTEGIRITDYHEWANNLCPVIKATPKGQSFICAVAHMNLANQAQKTGKPIMDECDAGIVKLVVPIFNGGQFLGAVGACGLLLDANAVDDFLVAKITEIDEEEVFWLSDGIGSISTEKVLLLGQFIEKRIEAVVTACIKIKNS